MLEPMLEFKFTLGNLLTIISSLGAAGMVILKIKKSLKDSFQEEADTEERISVLEAAITNIESNLAQSTARGERRDEILHGRIDQLRSDLDYLRGRMADGPDRR